MFSSSFPTTFTKEAKRKRSLEKRLLFLLDFSGIYFCSSLCRWTVWVGKAKEAPSSSTIFIMP